MSGDSKDSIPRGLVSRQTPSNSAKNCVRLPSLKNGDTSINSIGSKMLIHTNIATTKGGVVKRTFTPTIPSERKRSSTASINSNCSSPNESSKTETSKQKTKSKGKNHSNKKIIQMEGAVFNGINASKIQNSSSRVDTRAPCQTSVKRDLKRSSTSDKVKLTNEANNRINEFIGEKFIDDKDEDVGLVVPMGWETVAGMNSRSFEKTDKCCADKKPKLSNLSSPFELFKTESNKDKVLLFQIPELLLKRADGKVGKIIVYKSGRIVLVDNETQVKYDLFVSSSNNANSIIDNDVSHVPGLNDKNSMKQEIVSFTDDQLTSIAKLNNSDIVVVAPQIQTD